MEFPFGGDEDDALRRIADRLDVPPNEDRVLDRLDDLDESVNAVVAAADLERRDGPGPTPAPDASPVEKAEALARAVDRDAVSLVASGDRDPGGGADDGGVPSSIASDIARSRAPGDPTARRLLDELAAPGGSDSVREALSDAVDRLERHRTLDDALASAGAVVEDPRPARREIDQVDGPVADAVTDLLETLHETRDRLETVEAERERLAEAVDAVADARDVDGETALDRAEALRTTAGVDTGSTVDDGSPPLDGTAAVDLDPESRIATELVDDLADPEADPLPAVEEAIAALDRSAAIRSVVGDTDREAVEELGRAVRERAEAEQGAVADAVATRASVLLDAVDRAASANDAPVYAAERELRFYDDTLMDAVEGGTDLGDGAAASTARELGERVDERTEHTRRDYVDRLGDHNHSIPMHFLRVAETLADDADDRRNGGDPAVAVGLLRAADALIDAVEELYELNEYSMMLRRLRG
ncbi:MAG: hypothetical protein ABEI80_04155 [Haloplanus sp.]